MLTQSERVSSARKVIESLLRARKAVRIYPDSSPVATRAINELYADILRMLSFQDRVSFDIAENVIIFELEEIFHSASRENDIALLLFRAGVRELAFKTGLTRDEVAGFVHVIAADDERESSGHDIVTRMWDQDFKYIRCKVILAYILAVEELELHPAGGGLVKTDLSSEILRAHKEASLAEAVEESVPEIIEFSDEDLISLRKEVGRSPADKTGKLLAIALELFLLAATEEEYAEIEGIMKKMVEYAIKKGKVDVLADFFMNVKKAYMDTSSDPRFREHLSSVIASFSSKDFLANIGSLLDGGLRFDAMTIDKLACLLDRRSIPVLIRLLGYLDTISARKTIVNILAAVGKVDVAAVTEGLGDDRWYVVRNIVIVLTKIGDKLAKRHLIQIAGHRDARVRREAIKALAILSGSESLDILGRALDDDDQSVSRAALHAICEISIPQGKALLMERVQSRCFIHRAYEEKKEYIRALLHFTDEDVRLLLHKMLAKERIFHRAKNDENRAAIAYSIGAAGDKEFIPYLSRLANSRNEVLRTVAVEAMRKIGHER